MGAYLLTLYAPWDRQYETAWIAGLLPLFGVQPCALRWYDMILLVSSTASTTIAIIIAFCKISDAFAKQKYESSCRWHQVVRWTAAGEQQQQVKTMVAVLGSGGHTTMIQLLEQLDPMRMLPYVMSLQRERYVTSKEYMKLAKISAKECYMGR